MVLEIEEKGIGYNDYSFYIRLSAYAAVSDCKGIKKMVTMMESNPNFVVDLSVYAQQVGMQELGFWTRLMQC